MFMKREQPIKMNITQIQPDMKPLLNKSQIVEGVKLYYELGYKIDSRKGNNNNSNWIRTGQFKEIEDPMDMKISDNGLDDLEYIKHHNFMYK